MTRLLIWFAWKPFTAVFNDIIKILNYKFFFDGLLHPLCGYACNHGCHRYWLQLSIDVVSMEMYVLKSNNEFFLYIYEWMKGGTGNYILHFG